MNREERLQFIDDDLKGLWPDWEPTDAELRLWMGVLADPPYALARRALQQCFCGVAGQYRRPKPAAFLDTLKTLSASGSAARTVPQDIDTGVVIECLEPPESKLHLRGMQRQVNVLPVSRRGDLDYVMDCAESLRKQAEEQEGGHWIIVRPSPPVDDGLRGPPARQKACDNILAGPETAGRRYLTRKGRDEAAGVHSAIRSNDVGREPEKLSLQAIV